MSKKYTFAFFFLYFLFRLLGIQVLDKQPLLLITVYDVGQGDSILVEIGNVKVLIDGGPSYEIDRLLSSKFITNQCYIDILLLTHPHKDHVKGLNRVLEHCDVGLVIYNNLLFKSGDYTSFKALIKDLKVIEVKEGDSVKISNVTLYFLWPKVASFEKAMTNVNNASIVVLLDYEEFEALFMGDLEYEASSSLNFSTIDKYVQGGLDFYKVPHQGSRDSLNEIILSRYTPEICALSVGNNNNFGHPHPIVLEKLQNYGCNVYRTDIDGTLELSFE